MRFLGLVAGMALALGGTAQAASFSLVPTSDLFIGQGQLASFDVIYTQDAGDENALAVNLRITYDHDQGRNDYVVIMGSPSSVFDIPTFNPAANRANPFLPQNVVDIGGSQRDNPAVDATGGISLGTVYFGVEGPAAGNAGNIILTTTFPQTGSRDTNFNSIPNSTGDQLAIVYVPEPSLLALLGSGLFGLALLRRR